MSVPDEQVVFDAEDDLSDTPHHVAGDREEKRRAQNAIFDLWLTSRSAQSVLRSTATSKPRSLGDDHQSIAQLLAKQQSSPIVKNPRDYQLELFERAKTTNTIACLDTGSGKTLIAVLLLRHIIDRELEDRAVGEPHKVAFFLCCSVALAFQQFSVLETNLDHSIARLVGHDDPDGFSRSDWQQQFASHKVIVCTPAVLEKCLSRGHITMKQINLLVIDEAHHTKKNHPYAMIVRNHYRMVDPLERPRIFGMTASPVDSKTDFKEGVAALESLLDCTIITTTDMSLVEAVNRPSEVVLKYKPPLTHDYDSPFLLSLKQMCTDQDAFLPILKRASEISKHLGHWCADQFLLDNISSNNQEQLLRAGKKLLPNLSYTSETDVANAVAEATKTIQAVIDHVHDRRSEIEEANTEALRRRYAEENTNRLIIARDGSTEVSNIISPKVAKLLAYLALEFERENEQRCIVFVEWKQAARLLCRLLNTVGIANLRSGFVMGAGKEAVNDGSHFTLRSQILNLARFRSGETNCMIATAVAAEGLDIPSCNLVVRFSIYKTMIEYVQSRGRARRRNSKYVHMLEDRNYTESFLAEEVVRGERLMRQHCADLPEDRRLDAVSQDDQLPGNPKDLEIYIEQSTGARLATDNAMDVLAHFVTAVPVLGDAPPQYPTYTITTQGTKFQAEVILPGNVPICCATGKIRTKKKLARQSAAFEACMQLRKKAYLDEFFMPIYQKRLPAMRNAALATGLSKGKAYSMRSRPSLWDEARDTIPMNLWITLVDFVDGQLGRPHAKLLLLTRTPLPSFPSFPIYLNNGESVTIASKSLVLQGPIVATKHLIEKLTQFTLVVFNDVFSKEYLEEPDKLSYWLCPASQNITNEGIFHLPAESLVDHEILDEVVRNRAGFQWSDSTPTAFLLNKFIVDPWDGGRKFFTTNQVCHDLSPNDPIPSDGVQKRGTNSIIEFSTSLFKKSRAKIQWSSTQPVIVAGLSPYTTRRNLLAKPEIKERSDKTVTKAYICPEPLRISALSPELATTCLMWPAIIHRFESCLISLEGTSLVGVECSPELALMAFTKDSDSSGDHDANGEPIAVNIRSGMGENYERLEWLGDTFLKVATSISVFILNPDENEFEFHVRRMLMLCNKNLFRASEQIKLYEYVRSKAFSRRLWYPEGLSLVRGTGVKTGEAPKPMFHDPQTHDLSQKSIADVSEALIGAAFLHARLPGEWTPQQFDNAVRTVTKLVDSVDHQMLRWDDYKETYSGMIPSYQTGFVSAVQKDLAAKLETEHPYTWNYPRLAQVAFIHPSTPFGHIQLPNYQRLEFLGDALFDLAVVTSLFDRFPGKDPQFLTESKMAIVSNRFLGALCVKLGFHKHLRHNHSELTSSIRDYVVLVEEAHSEAERLAPSQPDRLKDYWITVQDPPKCLSDIVESFIGAMFIDSGFQYSVVQDFFDRHVKFFFEDMSLYDSFAGNHPVTRMTDILQNQLGCSDFRVLLRDYPGGEDGREKMLAAVLMVHDRIVEGTATTGTSGRYARVRVAKKAAEVFEGLSLVDFRARWGCTCSGKVAE